MRYPALIERENDHYGVVFPDIPGVVAMAATHDEVIQEAEAVLRVYVERAKENGWTLPQASPPETVETPQGTQLISVPLIRPSNGKVRVNCLLDDGLVDLIDDEARRRKMTRTSYIAWSVRRVAQMGG